MFDLSIGKSSGLANHFGNSTFLDTRISFVIIHA